MGIPARTTRNLNLFLAQRQQIARIDGRRLLWQDDPVHMPTGANACKSIVLVLYRKSFRYTDCATCHNLLGIQFTEVTKQSERNCGQS